MTQVSYPGVYIQEVPSGVRTIAGVATSVTAFVGYTRKGEMNKAVLATSYADFVRSHGGLDLASPLSYAVSQFYKNGGSIAYIVRVANSAGSAHWNLENEVGDVVLDVSASSPGSWGNDLRVHIELDEARNPDSEFNLKVLRDGAVLETHRNLTLESGSPLNVASVVNNASAYLRVNVMVAPAAFTQPAHALGGVFAASADVGNKVIAGTVFADNGVLPFQLDLTTRTWTTLPELVTALNDVISQNPSVRDALVAEESAADGSAGSGTLKISSVEVGEHAMVSISLGAVGGLASALKLGIANGGIEVTGAAQHRPAAVLPPPPPAAVDVNFSAPDVSGTDGLPGTATELIGNEDLKSGMQALLDVDLFNLLVIPETPVLSDAEAGMVIAAGALLCEKRRAFYIVDPPSGLSRTDILGWWESRPRSSHAAAYFPAVKISDPLDGFRPRTIAPSGTMAGVYSRIDATRGVWKAPAGMDATLNGVIDLELPLNDIENGLLNPRGINVLRSFPAQGRVAWGARTLVGDDALASEYKYIPIRRLALNIEESLYRGTQWVVFEPNDEPLYAQIRLNLGVFMNGLFRRGAFQGSTPQEAYFVKCDKETTTQADRDLGIVNIVVGFAPLKPAEFVVISIQQIAGDLG
jgi:phage tail sheath protein FI